MCVYVWGEVHGHTDASVCMYTNADKCDFSNTAWRKMHGFSSLKCWFDKREMRTLVIFVSPIWILHPKDGRTQREIKKLMGKLKENYNFVHVHVRFDFSTMALWIEAPWKHKQFVLIKRPCWAVCRSDLADAAMPMKLKLHWSRAIPGLVIFNGKINYKWWFNGM